MKNRIVNIAAVCVMSVVLMGCSCSAATQSSPNAVPAETPGPTRLAETAIPLLSTELPTEGVTEEPAAATPDATNTAEPTATPTAEPTATPTAEPTATPTAVPTFRPASGGIQMPPAP